MKLKLYFKEQEKTPLLEDISSVLYDFELLYNFCLVTGAKEYSDYNFPQGFWFRKRRGIKEAHKLRTSKILKESPLFIELSIAESIAALGAIWILIQAIDKVYNMGLNRRKNILEVKKLKLEIEKLEKEAEQKALLKELGQILENERNFAIFKNIARRLEISSIKLENIEIDTERENDNKM